MRVIGIARMRSWHVGSEKTGAIIPPYQFIPFAESSGLIVDITEQLLSKTAKDIVRLGWGSTNKFVSINIVPKHLTNNDLYQLISRERRDHNLPSSSISLEITERMKIDSLEQARECMAPFHRDGINFKLDDAGTGYGGFSYIQELGIGTIKIDKMFVDTIETEDLKTSVLESIISFARTSDLEAIAEGVETEQQLNYLRERNVFLIQGYLYAKPMPCDEFISWLESK